MIFDPFFLLFFAGFSILRSGLSRGYNKELNDITPPIELSLGKRQFSMVDQTTMVIVKLFIR